MLARSPRGSVTSWADRPMLSRIESAVSSRSEPESRAATPTSRWNGGGLARGSDTDPSKWMIEPGSSGTAVRPASSPGRTNRNPEAAFPSIRPATRRSSDRSRVSVAVWPRVGTGSKTSAVKSHPVRPGSVRGTDRSLVEARWFMNSILRGASSSRQGSRSSHEPPPRSHQSRERAPAILRSASRPDRRSLGRFRFARESPVEGPRVRRLRSPPHGP